MNPSLEQQTPLLSVSDLNVSLRTENGWTPVVRGIDFHVHQGETLCIVGESGSGKSISVLSVMGLLPDRIARVTEGKVMFDGRDLLTIGAREMNRIRGRDIGMIFQEPMTSLNPVMRVGSQISETLRAHEKMSSGTARKRALELLNLVRIPDAESRLDAYPHELSGGMRQRVMIAMALAMKPKLLIADEPTTALDVTVQAQILSLIDDLKRQMDMAVILITHDLGVVAEMADRVAVFRSGERVETAGVNDLFFHPQADYTRALIAATPRIGGGSWRDGRVLQALDTASSSAAPIVLAPTATAANKRAPGTPPALIARNLSKHFGDPARPVRAVNGVSFEIQRGETLSVVGESGCGKSTLARMLMLTLPPSSGEIILDGEGTGRGGERLRVARRRIQMVFQDPYASLHPRMTARQIVAEPLVNLGSLDRAAINRKVERLFDQVGLPSSALQRYAFEFSGGQRQRIAIARAIALEPSVVVADEPVSALDVSVQAQILNLFAQLQQELDISYLFISHDLSVVEYVSDRVAVMYLGQFVEIATRADLYARPQHPYTVMLFNSVPSPDPYKRHFGTLETSELPSPTQIPRGCAFRTRCAFATDVCAENAPPLVDCGTGHQVACHYPGIASNAVEGVAMNV